MIHKKYMKHEFITWAKIIFKKAKTCSKIYSSNAQGAKDYLVGRSNANNIDLNR